MSAYEISLLSVIGLNVILAVSLNMISGFCGQISLGHGAFYGAGAYAAALTMIATRNVPLSLVCAAAVASAGWGRGRLCFAAGAQRFSRRHHDRRKFSIHRLRAQTGVARRRDGYQRHSRFRSRRRNGNMVMILLFACATIALSLYINRSWMGFAFRAVSEDEDAAATLGINAGAYKLAAFGIGTALAGLAGGLYAFFTQFITADTFDFYFLGAADGDGGDRWHRIHVRRRRGRSGADAAAGGDPFRQRLPPAGFRRLLVLVIRLAPGGLAGLTRRLTRADGKAMIAALQLEDLAVHFGGVNAVDGVTDFDRARRICRTDRSERCRQDDAHSHRLRVGQAGSRTGRARRQRRHRKFHSVAGTQGAGADAPDGAAISRDDGARQCRARRRLPAHGKSVARRAQCRPQTPSANARPRFSFASAWPARKASFPARCRSVR